MKTETDRLAVIMTGYVAGRKYAEVAAKTFGCLGDFRILFPELSIESPFARGWMIGHQEVSIP